MLGEMANASSQTVTRFVERAVKAGWIVWSYDACASSTSGNSWPSRLVSKNSRRWFGYTAGRLMELLAR
jgi:hypothetical protein